MDTAPQEDDGRLNLDGSAISDTIEQGDASRRPSAPLRYIGVVGVLLLGAAIGWQIGRAGQPSAPPTRVTLSIEHLAGGASLNDSTAVPTIDGFLLIQDAPAGAGVDTITWGGLANRVTGTTSPINVTIQTKVNCPTAAVPALTFPPMTADLVAADGTRTTLPVAVVSTQRWQNVLASCLDPTHPEATTT